MTIKTIAWMMSCSDLCALLAAAPVVVWPLARTLWCFPAPTFISTRRSTTAAPHGQHRGVGWAHRWAGTLARVWLKDAVKDALSPVFGLKDAVEDAPRVGLA